jgi:hypothetical protein
VVRTDESVVKVVAGTDESVVVTPAVVGTGESVVVGTGETVVETPVVIKSVVVGTDESVVV